MPSSTRAAVNFPPILESIPKTSGIHSVSIFLVANCISKTPSEDILPFAAKTPFPTGIFKFLIFNSLFKYDISIFPFPISVDPKCPPFTSALKSTFVSYIDPDNPIYPSTCPSIFCTGNLKIFTISDKFQLL